MVTFDEPLVITAPRELFDPDFLIAWDEKQKRTAATVAAIAGISLLAVIIIKGRKRATV